MPGVRKQAFNTYTCALGGVDASEDKAPASVSVCAGMNLSLNAWYTLWSGTAPSVRVHATPQDAFITTTYDDPVSAGT